MRLALARPAALRLLRVPRASVPALVWAALALALGIAVRARGAPNGADHVLVGAFGAAVVPLLAYAVVGGVLGGRSLAGAVAGVVALGASPARAAGASVGVAIAATATLAALVGAGVAVVAHGVDDPPAVRDALASAYAGALGGAAYAALFSAAAALGRRGGGRPVALVVDWLLGSGGGAVALVTPRAHLRNLLGGAAPEGLGERESAVALGVIAVVMLGLALAGSRRQVG